jgi:hypothetical protein
LQIRRHLHAVAIMRRARSFRIAALVIAPLGCERGPDDRAADTPSVRRSEPRADNSFDPATIRAGDTIVGLVVQNIERQRTPLGEWVGSVRFTGMLTLSGHTFSHPDGADYPYPCFETDSASARRLPRWEGDQRRSWFCFENAQAARARLGTSPGRPATIRVDSFTVHRNLSDAVNSARLIDVISKSDTSVTATVYCFVTPGSVLARKPGTVAPGPADLVGWLQLDRPPGARNGNARLIDSDGRNLGATWERLDFDSIAVVGFDDFLRVRMRLSVTDSLASGSATAASDAATERDGAGRPVPFKRAWRVQARRATCDSVPAIRPT